jgi:hypothetical protein
VNNSRAEIMAALQKASSLSEQIALVSELEALDAREASNVADSRSLDFTSSIVDQTLSPVLVHEFHTASTDWLSMDDDNDDAGYHKTVMAKAAVWYGKVSPEVKADGAEFVEQARGIARRTASAYGTFAADAEATFLSYVAFLNREAASGLDQIDQSIDPNNMPKPTEYPAATFPTFQDPVHPINEQAFGQEGQWNNPLLMEVDQLGQGQGQAEWPAIPGGGTANSTNVTSVAISHSYNLDEFRQREAASTLDQITQTTAPDGVTFKPTPLPADVAYPWILGGPVVDPEADDEDFTQAAPAAIDKAVAARRTAAPLALLAPLVESGVAGLAAGAGAEAGAAATAGEMAGAATRIAPRVMSAGGGGDDSDDDDGYTASRRTAGSDDDSCDYCNGIHDLDYSDSARERFGWTGDPHENEWHCANCHNWNSEVIEDEWTPKWFWPSPDSKRMKEQNPYICGECDSRLNTEASRRTAAPADSSCRSCDATGKTKDGKNSCGNCGGMGMVPAEVNAPKNASRRIAGSVDNSVGKCKGCKTNVFEGDDHHEDESGDSWCIDCHDKNVADEYNDMMYEVQKQRKENPRTTSGLCSGCDSTHDRSQCPYRTASRRTAAETQPGLENHLTHEHGFDFDPRDMQASNWIDYLRDLHVHDHKGLSDHDHGDGPDDENAARFYTASRKTADMYGNSDMPHAVPQPNVANSPATTPQPQQGGSYSAGFAAGMADATVGDAPTYSDNSSGLEFSQGYVEGYSKGFDVVKSKVQKDQPYSAGGDNGQALRSGTALRNPLRRKKGPAADLPTDVSKLQLDRPKQDINDPEVNEFDNYRNRNLPDDQRSETDQSWYGNSPAPEHAPKNNRNLKRQLDRAQRQRTSSLFTPEEAFEIADFRKAYKFASKWNAGKPLVRTGSAEFEAGLYAGISDNPAAQDAWIAKHRKQASKFPEFGERIALHKDFSVKMLDSTDAMVKSAYLVQAATSTDLDTMAPSASPSPVGETPINGPGRPGPLAGGMDPARAGGPAPYNGVEPFGQGVIDADISTAIPATNKISEARKLATFRNAVQGGLSALAAHPHNNDKVMHQLQEKHDSDDGLGEDDEDYEYEPYDTIQEWLGEK